MDDDLALISGKFLREDYFDFWVPKSKQYLSKYFELDWQRRLLAHMIEIDPLSVSEIVAYKKFIETGGWHIPRTSFRRCLYKYRGLERELREAIKNFDLELVEKIKTGNFRAAVFSP